MGGGGGEVGEERKRRKECETTQNKSIIHVAPAPDLPVYGQEVSLGVRREVRLGRLPPVSHSVGVHSGHELCLPVFLQLCRGPYFIVQLVMGVLVSVVCMRGCVYERMCVCVVCICLYL